LQRWIAIQRAGGDNSEAQVGRDPRKRAATGLAEYSAKSHGVWNLETGHVFFTGKPCDLVGLEQYVAGMPGSIRFPATPAVTVKKIECGARYCIVNGTAKATSAKF